MSPPFADLPLLVSGLVFTPITPTAGRSRGISRALYDQMCGVWAEKREATTGEKEGVTKYQGRKRQQHQSENRSLRLRHTNPTPKPNLTCGPRTGPRPLPGSRTKHKQGQPTRPEDLIFKTAPKVLIRLTCLFLELEEDTRPELLVDEEPPVTEDASEDKPVRGPRGSGERGRPGG